jgi:hypothetical protein
MGEQKSRFSGIFSVRGGLMGSCPSFSGRAYLSRVNVEEWSFLILLERDIYEPLESHFSHPRAGRKSH